MPSEGVNERKQLAALEICPTNKCRRGIDSFRGGSLPSVWRADCRPRLADRAPTGKMQCLEFKVFHMDLQLQPRLRSIKSKSASEDVGGGSSSPEILFGQSGNAQTLFGIGIAQ